MSFGKNSIGALDIVDSNDYYPFGMNHLKSGNAYFATNSYKSYQYNGKELQETGINGYGTRCICQTWEDEEVVDHWHKKWQDLVHIIIHSVILSIYRSRW